VAHIEAFNAQGLQVIIQPQRFGQHARAAYL
jgi:hypothetical protein